MSKGKGSVAHEAQFLSAKALDTEIEPVDVMFQSLPMIKRR